MGGGSAPSAPKTNYQRDIRQFVAGMKGSMGDVLGVEGRYRDNFQGLNLNDASSFLYGTGGNQGLVALNRNMIDKAGNQLARARGDEIGTMTNQAGDIRGLLQAVSPESAKMVNMAYQDAMQAQRSAQGLSGQESRSARQFALEGSMMQGRGGDNSALAAQILNRDNILTQKRQEASQLTQNAYNMANSFYSAPGLQALSAVPNSYQAGLGMTQMGLSAIGAGKPQLVDIGAGLNLGAANRQNQFAANASAAGKPNPYISAGTGALSGAAAGATIGSAVPIFGTAVGAIVGGAAGYYSAR